MLTIYTDGSHNMNLKVGGWAYLMFDERCRTENSGFEIHTTNNTMELRAIYEALIFVRDKLLVKNYPVGEIHIYTDSQYCAQYLQYHKVKECLTSDMFDTYSKIHNKLLLKATMGLINTLPYRIFVHKVTGHSVDAYNQYVDRLAVKARRDCEAEYFKKDAEYY